MSVRFQALAATTLLTLAIGVAPAHAEDGVWKVGTGYVIRFEKLDLRKAEDRQTLLGQVERTAAKACRGMRPATARMACAEETLRSIMKSVEPSLRASLDVARFERDGVMQASR
jgi:UrcA family protein